MRNSTVPFVRVNLNLNTTCNHKTDIHLPKHYNLFRLFQETQKP